MDAGRPIDPARLAALVRDPVHARRFTAAERVTIERVLGGRGLLGGPWAIPVLTGAAFALAVIGFFVYAVARVVPASAVGLRAELLADAGMMAEALAVLAGWLFYQSRVGRDLRAALLGAGPLSPRLAQLLAFRRAAPKLAPALLLICGTSVTLGYFALTRARVLEVNSFPGAYRATSLAFALAAFVSLALALLGWVARLCARVLEKTRVVVLTDAALSEETTGGRGDEIGV